MTPALGHPLDASFLVFGDPDVVTAVLDPYVCNALLWIAWTRPSLVVRDGLVARAALDAALAEAAAEG